MDTEGSTQTKILVGSVGSVVTKELFAELSGLGIGVVRCMMHNGQLPTVKIGKRRLINYALLNKECLEEEFEL